MKKFWYIIPAIFVTASSCTSLNFTGTATDDLYFRPSEQPVTTALNPVQAAADGQNYYDNIFAADTLIADEYIPDNEYMAYNSDAGTTVVNNYYGSSAAERIYLFNDDYFYPYWRDPFYFSPFSMRLSFGYGYYGSFGYPYSWGYDPFWSDFYSPWSYYSPYYSYWGGYPYYSYYGYNSFNPWFSGFGYLPYYNSSEYPRTVGRRGGYSSMARGTYTSSDTRSKSGYAPSGTLNSRRTVGTSAAITAPAGTTATGIRRNTQDPGTYTKAGSSGAGTVTRPEYTRRDAPGNTVQTQTRTQSTVRPEIQSQTRTQSQYQPPARTQTQTQSVNRPQYQTTERTYTPSYDNPRVSSRPSYNTTRSSGTVQNTTPAYNRSTPTPGRSTSGYSPSRSSSPSVQYSSPSRSSSSPSYNRSSGGSSSSYSGGRSSSYSSGSSSSGSSYSSGSSSSSSSSSSTSSSSSSSSGGRRR